MPAKLRGKVPHTPRKNHAAPPDGEDEPETLLELEHFTPYRVHLLGNTISNTIAEAYEREFGLSVQEWRIMAVVGRFPGISANGVCERTAMDKVSVSRAVQNLLRARRLTRTKSRNDRRLSVLRLSPAGYNVYREIAPRAIEYERLLLESLSPRDRQALDRLLGLLMQRAEELAHTPSAVGRLRRAATNRASPG